ncbi:centrosomal protein of 89 kDa [Nematolebias whitei]|uniref:centrosomal protein of 89 kDa n=1 Tax=Nematolebias whitei TaxID=451745 RepID=UPI00189750E9|nr:centrosomal protein of 89 kDa [Nematolebias whitei]
MLKFSFRREKDKDFRHIAPGLIPAASIAPKAAVPRTPPPRSPHPSPERPRSALAAAILSSSLTGQTWAIPPARRRSFSETGQSESFTSNPNFSTVLYARDRWSEDLASRSHLSSLEHSEGELENREEDMDNGEDGEEHVYQTLDRREHLRVTECVHDLPAEAKSTTPLPAQMSDSRVPSPDPSKIYSEVRKKKMKMADEQKFLEKRLERLEQQISQCQTSSKQRSSAGSQTELQSLRQQAQELVDENDALKLTAHRLSVELSRYQARFRPLSKQETSKISVLPKTGSPPPWLLDVKNLCPLLLAYEDRMDEKDALLQSTEEEVKKLRVHAEEVIKENERLHEEMAKINVDSQKDCQQLQQQAFLVLQENQVLTDQLEAQHAKAKASHGRQQSEVTKMSKQTMLLEAETQRLQEDLEESKKEAQQHAKKIQVLQANLKDAVTWDEHCSITGKLRRQLEQEESRSRSEMERLLRRVSSLQEDNKSLALDKNKLTADVETLEAELQRYRRAQRKAERRTSTLKRQNDECILKEEKTRHYLGAVVSVAEHISKERDQLLHVASVLQQEKQGFVSSILKGTVRFSKLQDEIKSELQQRSRLKLFVVHGGKS